MSRNPSQRFLDNQRRCLARHDFDGFKAQHHVHTATDQVDMGWRVILHVTECGICREIGI